MIHLLKILACVLALVLLVVAGGAWWLFRSDSMEAPALAGIMEAGSMEYGGHTRSWQVYIPAAELESAPVVLVLHGSGGDGQRMLDGTRHGFNILAERDGFIPVYPDGFEKHWNDCRGSAAYSANVQNIDDVGFLLKLVRQLAGQYDVDLSRVYVTGLSNGGHMAYRLGLEAPDAVAGIAAIAANLPADQNLGCQPSGRPVRTMIVNGTEDPVNPYQGGVVEILGDSSRGMVRSAGETARYWAGLAGYEGEGETLAWPERAAEDGTSVESASWSAPGKPEVVLVTVTGGGHTIPHRELNLPLIVGRTSHEFDATELIWAFFSGESYLPE